MTSVTRIASMAALLVAGGACGPTPQPVTSATPAETQTVTIEVVNQNFYDANILANYEGEVQRRLGFVQGFQTDTFTLPWRNHQLVMISQFVGGGGVVSNILTVSPGDVLEFRILPDAHRRR